MSKKSAIVESSLYGQHNMKLANQHEMEIKADHFDDNFEFVTPVELEVTSDEIIPSGLPIGSSAFIVDKVAVAFCNGEDRWYSKPDNSVYAGLPWSYLF